MSNGDDDPATFPLPPIPPATVPPLTWTGQSDSPLLKPINSPGGGGSGWAANAADLGKALGDLAKGVGGGGGQTDGGAQSRPIQAQAGSAQSGTGRGSPEGIAQLIQMLMGRANAYFPGQPNRQPVTLARPSGGGLLGI